MKGEELKGIIQGILFAKGEAVSLQELARIIEKDQAMIREVIKDLQSDLNESKSGLQITQVAGGYQLTTKPELNPYIKKMMGNESQRGLSQAALETLAIIAYRQPITRVEIEEIRGVRVDRVLYSLMERELIRSVGRKDVPGKPILFGTTDKFLLHFGLNSIEELPRPEDFSQTLFDNQYTENN
ncbi:SMC-Scp complex subunit ScpB [Natranaerobius thermophilus]|uniref:Segregation and condensation protein B n=1 Tax=Natranaerobius thermophilus (strain ATCC BAA-1301 / DSM 18059 / JW/NM-WN-LF) TaxID=457570 RepID=B2A4Y3_NATTJ|nr:SMC-Scp complex subunit ScpB [Natranaerobius thermophilus]ACB85225.1 segregation and condensation protein B [Natranaerobius thermophilus JW/NM-WN-LF]